MKNTWILITIIFFSCVSATNFETHKTETVSVAYQFDSLEIPKNVLFIGNSYTYFWNLPTCVELMAKSQKVDLKTRSSLSGGTNLGQHWRGERNLKSQEKVKSGNFDAMVLQDHSMRAIQHPDSLLYFGKQFCDLAKANNVKPYIYMTWARKWNPLMQSKITEKYLQLAKENDVQIVPVGLAWQKARELRPDLDLYDPDGSHPSTMGTYLTACVFYAVFTRKSPVGLPHRLMDTDKDGDPLYIMITNKNDAAFCQEVAKTIVDKFL